MASAGQALVQPEPSWIATRRARAGELVSQRDVPSFKGRKGWEFTPLAADFDLSAFEPVGAGGPDPLPDLTPAHVLAPPAGATELLQVDSATSPGVRVEDGPVVLPLDVAIAEHPELVEPYLGSVVGLEDDADIFVATNEQRWTGGAFVWVPRGVSVELPVLLTTVSAQSGSALHRRTLIVLEEGAEAEVWEQHLSADAFAETVLNTVVELHVGPNANLRYLNAQDLNESSLVFGDQRATVERDGHLEWAALGFGGRNGRVSMVTTLAGPGADARVTGAYAPHKRQHVDYDTYQEHAAPNCVSDLAFRGILAGRSSSVWRGMIKVDPDAQQTDAFQECRNLLLTKRAHADAIPGLEILANDVACTHAAAVAQIDAEQVFYLRSRGLSEEVARKLVIEGFLAELVARFPEASELRAGIAAALEARLAMILS